MTPTWTTKDGSKISIKEMSDAHLKNAVNMLIREYEDDLNGGYCATARPPAIDLLQAEIERRQTTL